MGLHFGDAGLSAACPKKVCSKISSTAFPPSSSGSNTAGDIGLDTLTRVHDSTCIYSEKDMAPAILGCPRPRPSSELSLVRRRAGIGTGLVVVGSGDDTAAPTASSPSDRSLPARTPAAAASARDSGAPRRTLVCRNRSGSEPRPASAGSVLDLWRGDGRSGPPPGDAIARGRVTRARGRPSTVCGDGGRTAVPGKGAGGDD